MHARDPHVGGMVMVRGACIKKQSQGGSDGVQQLRAGVSNNSAPEMPYGDAAFDLFSWISVHSGFTAATHDIPRFILTCGLVSFGKPAVLRGDDFHALASASSNKRGTREPHARQPTLP
jgi:hypothetical protein